MVDKNLSNVVVFDLDDTLYFEADYVLSGRRAIAELVLRLFNVHLNHEIVGKAGEDFLERVLKVLSLPDDVKVSLLWHYRLHYPTIVPRPHIPVLLRKLRERGDAVCILTDGRSVTQRLKINALGLDVDGIYVSEELGAMKPDRRGYEQIQRDFPSGTYTYVGDNPGKDFLAPNALGWATIGLVTGEQAIHSFNLDNVPIPARPRHWVSNILELADLLDLQIRTSLLDLEES